MKYIVTVEIEDEEQGRCLKVVFRTDGIVDALDAAEALANVGSSAEVHRGKGEKTGDLTHRTMPPYLKASCVCGKVIERGSGRDLMMQAWEHNGVCEFAAYIPHLQQKK